MIDTGKKMFGWPVFVLEPAERFTDPDKHLPAVKIADREAAERIGDNAVAELENKCRLRRRTSTGSHFVYGGFTFSNG